MADLKVKVGIDKSGFTTGLASMENSVKGFGNKVGGILAGAFAFDKIIQGFSTAIEKGDQLQDLANRFGIAASSLQEIGNAASLSGAGIEDVAGAMNKLALNAGKAIGGNDAMIQSFQDIGLSVEQLKGMSPQDIFFALSKSVSTTADPLVAFARAAAVAGKNVGALMETMRMGPETIAATGQAMGVWSDETTRQLSEASDAIKIFQNTMTKTFGVIAQIAMPLIKTFEDLVQLTTMLTSAAGSAITGDFAGASEITKEAGKIKIRRDQEEARQERLKRQAGRGFDAEGSEQSSSSVNKAAEIEKNKLKSAEDKLADAVRDRETLSMNSSQKLGRAQAELVKLKMDELAIADKTIEKLNAQEGIERKKIEVLELQNDVNKEIQDAEKDFMRAAKANDLDGMQEANERGKRLEKENKARGNAADFDPRAALMDRYGLGKQASDIPSSTEAKPIQPVKLENPPDLKGIMDKLDMLIKNAGVFS